MNDTATKSATSPNCKTLAPSRILLIKNKFDRMKLFNFLFSNKRTEEMNLPIFGKVNFDTSENAELFPVLCKDDYNLDNNVIQIDLKLKTIDKNSEKIVSNLLLGLNELHDKCKFAFLEDFNNDESIEYIDGLFKRIFSQDVFNIIVNKTSREQRLLSALNIYNIQINQLDVGFNIALKYIYGHELAIEFQADKNIKLISCQMSAGEIGICSKQHSDWIKKLDNIEVKERCTRFFGEGWYSNHSLSAYYINKMAEKIKW